MNGTANLRLRCVGDGDSIELSVGNGAYGRYTGPGTYTLDGTGTFGAAIYRARSMTTFVDAQYVVPSSGCVVTVVDAPHGVPPRGSRIRGTFECADLVHASVPPLLVDIAGSYDLEVR